MFSPAEVAHLRDQFAKLEAEMDHKEVAINHADRAIGKEPPYDQLYAQLAVAYALIAQVERLDALIDTEADGSAAAIRVVAWCENS